MSISRISILVLAAVAMPLKPSVGEDSVTGGEDVRFAQLQREIDQLRAENREIRTTLGLPTDQDSPSLSNDVWLSDQPVRMAASFEAPPPIATLQSQQNLTPFLAPTEEDSHLRIQRLETRVDQLEDDLTISLLNKEWSATVTGAVIGEMIFSEQRPIIPSAIVLISPDFGNDTPTVDVHGKSTRIGVLLRGPDIGGMQTGGAALTYLFGEDFLADRAGVNILAGYAELRNEHWRLLFGRARDLINPRIPGTLDVNGGRNAGNLGFTRGQFRIERYFYPSQESQTTVQLSLSNPIATSYNGSLSSLVEDAGWPIVTTRVVVGIGPIEQKLVGEVRPYEMGATGLIGQLRRAQLDDPQIFDVWAMGVDARARLSRCCGLQAEFFQGQGLGNLNGGILQIFDPNTFQEVRTVGGWGDLYVYWTDRLHTHLGGGIDNPLNDTVAPARPTQNAFAFVNLIWDVAEYFEIGVEVGRWDTDYAPAPALGANAPQDNTSMIYRTRVVLRF